MSSADVVQAFAGDNVDDLAELMIDNRISVIPIVDRFGMLVGTVDYIDVLKALLGKRRATARRASRRRAR